MALECPGLQASVFCVARLWASSESGAAFLHDGVLEPCLVGLPVLERWQWRRRLFFFDATRMKEFACRPDLRCVKTQRIGSRSNVYTNASQPVRTLQALGYVYEPAVCRASLSVSV